MSKHTPSGKGLVATKPTRGSKATDFGDVHQNPTGGPVTTTDNGGPVLTNVEVAAIFWGSYWSSTSSPPSPTPDTYYQAFTGIVTGPYMTGLRQYRGVGPGTMLGMFVNDDSDPANGYSDGDVANMLTSYFQHHPSAPAPAAGHQRFYAVVSPPGVNNGLSGDLGQHQSFTYNGVTAYYCWIDSIGGLTDSSSDGVINTFSHELVETCTDPLGNAINTSGGDGSGEIGDARNNEYAIVDMNGLSCNVQCYWSAADNACIIPLGTLSFLINKSTFGKDEVQEAINAQNGVFSNAFWLALDGFSIDTFNSFGAAIPTPTGPFAGLSGVHITPSPAMPGGPPPQQPIPVYEDNTDTTLIQRIRFSFDITFDQPLTTPFPASGAAQYGLTATFTTNGTTVPGPNSQDTVEFELAAGEDPYFSNIDPADSAAVSWLSRDLRVFTITEGESAIPGDPSAPVLSTGQTPYDYIQALIGYLNGSTAYTVPTPSGSPDPLNGLPGQGNYETGLSSVTPLDPHGNQNYNFAIARTRMTSEVQGSSSEATDVRVFFRLWVAPSYDTDFNPNTTYPSNPAYPALPRNPLPSSASLPPDPTGVAIQTTPFFATGKTGASDYDSSVQNNNIRTLEIPVVAGQDSVWAYYGCFLDVYDVNNNCSYPGTHHCLVAQIAYDNAPLLYGTNAATNPGNTDKLAQRNLQITLSGNPGPAPTHRIPQAFDTRPSAPFVDGSGALVGLPDELMIDWGDTPVGARARIFWPGVPAAEVLALADRLYGTHLLSAADSETIAFQAVKGATYVPIPSGAGKQFSGLFTVDLPLGVRKGQKFSILVRRISTHHAREVPAERNGRSHAADAARVQKWRYITGTFQVNIPVTTEPLLLGPEENTLAILKARLAAMSPTYRWRPVLERYIEYVAGRVDGSGGNATAIPPSLTGVVPLPSGHGHHHPGPGHEPPHHREREREHTGKISGLMFDRFGDFEGFILDTRSGDLQFYSRERDLRDLAERAWRERLRISVRSDEEHAHHAWRIVLRDPPAPFGP